MKLDNRNAIYKFCLGDGIKCVNKSFKFEKKKKKTKESQENSDKFLSEKIIGQIIF